MDKGLVEAILRVIGNYFITLVGLVGWILAYATLF